MSERILVVQTCNPNLLEYVIKDVKARFPESQLTILLQPQMKQYLSDEVLAGCEILVNPKSKRTKILRELRRHRYKCVVFALSGESGFWKLKMLPIALFPSKPLAYDRLARPISLKPTGLARWTKESLLSPIQPFVNPKNIFRKIAAVPVALYLSAFYTRQKLFHPYRRKSALKASRRK